MRLVDVLNTARVESRLFSEPNTGLIDKLDNFER
jgi:hypothetical protein